MVKKGKNQFIKTAIAPT